ncbi:hypothetical protein TRVL_09638 [Trypanosoma vivax]|nr:hypothetical protein TRVL_09638 [Trypanosoma vivax]
MARRAPHLVRCSAVLVPTRRPPPHLPANLRHGSAPSVLGSVCHKCGRCGSMPSQHNGILLKQCGNPTLALPYRVCQKAFQFRHRESFQWWGLPELSYRFWA